jgi:hypothetical protein|uniref:Uncharacterized protein n=1 Tax=Sphingobacterium sp. (strain 21) TaxID=743722 RepID=F4CAR9_SPHS2
MAYVIEKHFALFNTTNRNLLILFRNEEQLSNNEIIAIQAVKIF